MKKKNILGLLIGTISALTVASVQAGDKTKSSNLDCAAGSLAAAISGLDRSIANVINFTGDCVEDILIEGHRDLTLIGVDGASISPTVYDPASEANSTNPLIISRSKVTIESVTLNGGKSAVLCTDRSDCVFRNINVIGGHNGIAVQSQSAADVLGSGSIVDSQFAGIGVFGNSSLNLRPTWANGFDPDEPSYTISGHFWGVLVQDGGFFRSDNASIQFNTNRGVNVRRGAIAKLISQGVSPPGINNNGFRGIDISDNSTAQVITPTSGNAQGLAIGALSSVQASALNHADGVSCYDDTARSSACP